MREWRASGGCAAYPLLPFGEELVPEAIKRVEIAEPDDRARPRVERDHGVVHLRRAWRLRVSFADAWRLAPTAAQLVAAGHTSSVGPTAAAARRLCVQQAARGPLCIDTWLAPMLAPMLAPWRLAPQPAARRLSARGAGTRAFPDRRGSERAACVRRRSRARRTSLCENQRRGDEGLLRARALWSGHEPNFR
jgi:hypothetical protein